MTAQKNENDFDNFIGNLKFAYQQFCLSAKLDEKLKNIPLAQEQKLFWFTVGMTLRRGYHAEIAKIFEKQNSKFPDVLSIYYLIDIEFKEHEKTIISLKKLRDKLLMHHDVETLRQVDYFAKSLNLTPRDVQNLFIKLFEVIERIKLNYGFSDTVSFGYEFNKIEIQAEKDLENLLSKLYTTPH